MRSFVLSLTGLLALHAGAQCPFDPTITPEEVILCPNEDAVLSTQEYDGYQWYKAGEAIVGETGPTLTMAGFDAVGYEFTVEATLDGCTEMSPARYVDGHMFLLPNVQHGGDEAYLIDETGAYHCEGDTVLLTFSYSENVQWTVNGSDIPGATNQLLQVVESGVYHVSGAPEDCPNYIQDLGVEIALTFTESTQSTIVENDGQLCAEPTGTSYIWYLDGEAIVGSNSACITPDGSGSYTVLVDQSGPCELMSAPFLATAIGAVEQLPFVSAPNPASNSMRISWPSGVQPTGTWQLTDMGGRIVRRGAFSSLGQVNLDVRELADGKYLFHTGADGRWAPLPVLVAH
ncbi:MAG TPA: hypothetical protein VGE21_14735 [Flavobacteriales bacterium]